MTRLKYRLRELLPRLSEQAKVCQEGEIKRRLFHIRAVANSQRSIKAACEFRGIGRDSFYQWTERLLEQEDISALAPLSRRPKTRAANQTKASIEKRVIELRNKKPYQGPERLSDALEEEFGIHLPPSTIYAVLNRNKLISKEYRARRTKKHTKRYRRAIPGYMQMDFKYVSYLINDHQYYQLSAVDHCTSWRLIRIYRRKNEESVKAFLHDLVISCPFPIFEIQTDNDAAFTDKYSVGHGDRPTGAHPLDEWCASHGWRHKLIPIGQKELNGKVENTHKYDDEEFFSQIYCTTFAVLKAKSREHNEEWNERRRTKTLGWRTPAQLVEEMRTTILIIVLFCQPQATETDVIDTLPVEAKKLTPAPKIKTTLDRYLAWMAWRDAQYPDYSLLFVSGMSLSYSAALSSFKRWVCKIGSLGSRTFGGF